MQDKSLYPMKFTPILKQKLWGGSRLQLFYRHNLTCEGNVGESWDLSDIEGSESEVENGFLQENTLGELLEVYMGDLVGDEVFSKFGAHFPLLVKLIDTSAPLSIQVHPDDEMAKEEHGDDFFGKNEMWYVLAAEPGASLYIGFDRYVQPDELRGHIANNTLENVCHRVDVKAGDTFFIPAGCVHSIGEGITLLEVQTTSDLTYRLYDFNRKDADGKPRELHTELALKAIDYDNWRYAPVDYAPVANEPVKLVECGDFTANMLCLTKPQEYELATISSFVVLVCVEGHVSCQFGDDYITMVEGETLFIPAEMNSLILVPTGEAKLVEVYVNLK